MTVSINGVQIANGYFDVNEVVMDQCFVIIEYIAVQNRNNDAWTGAITVTVNGVETGLKCEGCSGSPFRKFIVVDGNGDSKDQAATHCQNGDSCTLSVSGKKGNLL